MKLLYATNLYSPQSFRLSKKLMWEDRELGSRLMALPRTVAFRKEIDDRSHEFKVELYGKG